MFCDLSDGLNLKVSVHALRILIPLVPSCHGHPLVKVLDGGGYCGWYLFPGPISGEVGGSE